MSLMAALIGLSDLDASSTRTPEPRNPQLEDSTTADDDESRALHVAVAEQVSPAVTKRAQFLVLLCAFLVVFETIGLNQGYGVFQQYYTSEGNAILPAQQAKNRALVAFIGTLGTGLTWSGSIFVNPLMSRLRSTRTITMAGAVVMSLGFGLASFATQSWHLLLTQGLLYGIGSSMVYFPAVSIAPEYFDRRRGAAMGVVLSAAGVGGLVMSPLIRMLLTSLGPRSTLRVLSLMCLVITAPMALIAPSPRSDLRRPMVVNLSLAKTPKFVFQVFAAFLQAGGNYVPLTFLTEFSASLGYTAAFSAVLLGVSNGVNSASRIVMGFAADALGRQNLLVLSVFASALSVLVLWMKAAESLAKGTWIAFIVFYGISAGGYNALLPTTITELFGVQAYASVNGFVYFIRGLGAFFGSPVGGIILGNELGSDRLDSKASFARYEQLIWYDGSLLLACSVCVAIVRGLDALEKHSWKWKA